MHISSKFVTKQCAIGTWSLYNENIFRSKHRIMLKFVSCNREIQRINSLHKGASNSMHAVQTH